MDFKRNYYTLSYNPENIKYKQDGKFFYANGRPVEEEVSEEEQIEELIPDIKWDTLNWREIKKLVIEAGGEWTNKAEGIKYLKG